MEAEEVVTPHSGHVVFPPDLILEHAKETAKRFHETPEYASFYLGELLKNNGLGESRDERVEEVRRIINELESRSRGENEEINKLREFIQHKDAALELQKASKEISFRKKIEEYYLPEQLVNAILEKGEIPDHTEEQFVGIGFIDIADYSFLSKFLSPNENQMVLNGLYAAFSHVLKRHGGFLNKIEGDSLMFHFGGSIDPELEKMGKEEKERYISRELFYTCIEMQRVAFLFNQANDRFLYNEEKSTREAVLRAFEIISAMRTSADLSQVINAYFQIRIRIGANIGEVTVGNFGPEGAKQWDIIGVPVIKAKRMEATAPIGGFRISEEFYNILNGLGIVDEYYRRFKREAEALFGSFKNITMDELFSYGSVTLKDKRNAAFHTYSVQVNPGLPEALMNQVDLLLNKEEDGTQRIIEMLKYYRGNRFVINGIESVFARRGVYIRKGEILSIISPAFYEKLKRRNENDNKKTDRAIQNDFSLYNIFELFSRLQDTIKEEDLPNSPKYDFTTYEQYMQSMREWKDYENSHREKRVYQRTYFFNYIFPMVFYSIQASIYEFQHKSAELTEVGAVDEAENRVTS
ncbi:MAG: adenylate/guanylate cyclase domain-containing protein [Spirochaetaceae bacterium]